MDNIIIFDTTLRDGEQSPGASMNMHEKIQIALQLEKLGVDVIESGFAAASLGDFEAIKQISNRIENSIVCSLARALEKDIKRAGEAISSAKNRRIHTFIATSDIHMKYKLKMTPDEVIKRAVESVQYAKTFTNDIEFSCEDAGRSDIKFMQEILDAVINAGATTLNIPDTVGYRLPDEMKYMISQLKKVVQNRAIISVHCHNDLGLAVANSLASVEGGARQIECTINGLGERAGNAALEELVMTLKTRADKFSNIYTNINTKEIFPTSQLVANITGISPQPNKAIVGKNAFAHESGIHQDGILKHQETYEIMRAEDIGLEKNSLVLGKLSGRHAFSDRIKTLGYELKDNELNEAFKRFKLLADKKKEIFDDDIRAIIADEFMKTTQIYEFVKLKSDSDTNDKSTATITMKENDKEIFGTSTGAGTMDTIFNAIDDAVNIHGKLKDYRVSAVSRGKDALARVVVKVQFEDSQSAVIGHGLNIDTVIASSKAYIGALNSYISMKKNLKIRPREDEMII